MVLSGPIAAAERWLSLSPRGGVHHEAVAPDGSLRPHWRGLVGWMEAAGPEGLAAAARELERARAESGIAFSLDPGASTTADPLPVVLSSTDWQAVEAGIIQRARLAEAALADVYGARAQGHGCLLAEGILPPGLVYGTQAFAAHCAGWETPPARYTYVYEADIARTAAGDWVVLADRLDAPLGDGWQIANRIATSQSFAEPFLDLGVRRVASHYARFQELLDSLTGWEGRLALLTGGEQDPRFFSHAYLARYLNAALVEPGDVTVREGAAFVKTLDGLKKIDVMLRGVPDLAVDALHRQRTAAPGAPALSLAVRSGALTLGNAAGSSVLAHRALAPFAHAIAARLLGEDLTISDAPCLWLGDPAAQEELRAARLGEGPDAWSIDPLTRRRRKDDPSSPTDRDALEALLEQSAEAHVAQSIPPLAETPVMRDGRVEAARWMMRVFACWTGEEWSVAPSGVAAEIAPGGPIPALGFGKDVWVLANADDQPSEPSR
ncbi:MAG: circularly permuted type 2 ATP-grasp protein, partial [Pseudomonadota bacterium]